MNSETDWKSYEQYLRKEELAEGTIDIYIRQAKILIEKMGEEQLTKEYLLIYREKMQQEGFADTTMNLNINAVNRYLKYIGKEECRLRTRRIQKRRSLENVLSLEEYRKMLFYAKNTQRFKYYHIMRTMASTGIRVSELSYFTVEAIEKSWFCVQGKGKSREIYLTKEMQMGLKSYCWDNGIKEGIIFRGNGNAAISREAVYKMLQNIAISAGVPAKKAHPHSFRHLFAKTYMERYGNLTELADILGHSSLETTRIYTASTVEEKCRKIEQLGF